MKLVIGCVTVLSMAILPATELSAQSPPPQNQIWFTPNVGSVDMLDLFNNPEQWASARSKIDVFKFYTGQVGTGGWSCAVNSSANCGAHHLQNLVNIQAFSQLGQWGIDIAVESFFAGPIMSANPVKCSTSQYIFSLTLDGSVNVIQNVQSNGGTVATWRWMSLYGNGAPILLHLYRSNRPEALSR